MGGAILVVFVYYPEGMSFLKYINAVIAARWQKTLYVMFFAQLMTAVGFSSIFPFLPLYVQDLGAVSDLSIELLAGLVFSGPGFYHDGSCPFLGLAGRPLRSQADGRTGPVRWCDHPVLMAFARSAEELVILRAIQGLITGTVAAANALVAAQAPRERAGYAMGLLTVSMGGAWRLAP
jgi:MFS transporter, DHA1 family, multidrug resistance protein